MPFGVQRFRGIPAAPAALALHPHVWQKVHLDAALPQPLAQFTPPARHVKAERAGRKSASARLGQFRKQRADVIEHAGVCCRRRARRGADGFLIHQNHLVDLLEALHRIVRAWLLAGRVQATGKRPPEHFQYERSFSTAAGSCDGRHHTQRKTHVDSLERAMADASHFEPAGRLPMAVFQAPSQHRITGSFGTQIGTRHALWNRCELCGRGMGHNPAAFTATAGAKVEGVVGALHHIAIVFDHHKRVAEITEFSKSPDELVCVARVQADRGLIQHIEHACQAAANLSRQANALQFTSRQAARRPGHVEILQANVHQKRHS